MNDALYRALRIREGVHGRKECWLGTRMEREEERAEDWREHMAALFEPARRERATERSLEIATHTPRASAAAKAIVALVRSCGPGEMMAITEALQVENDLLRQTGYLR